MLSNPTANEFEQLKAKTEQLTQSLSQLQGLQKAKEQEITKLLEEAGVESPEAYLAKAAEMEQQQLQLLSAWKQQLAILEPQITEVSRELHL